LNLKSNYIAHKNVRTTFFLTNKFVQKQEKGGMANAKMSLSSAEASVGYDYD
jgi:hypothetical protein